MESKKINSKPSKWLDDFLAVLSKKEEKDIEVECTYDQRKNQDEKVTIAEINVKDLPSLTWNDEKFYCLFNEDGTATIFNQFTNIVTTINAKTIEDVDKVLNSKQVISEKNNDELLITISELRNELSSLRNEITALKSQQMAYNPILTEDNLADIIMQEEVKHFSESAQAVSEQIDFENSKDLTTMKGRNSLLTKALDIEKEFDNINEELVDEELVNEELINEELVDEELVNEELINEELVNEELVNEELINEELVNEELVNEELVNEELVDEELINEELVNEDLVNEENNLPKEFETPKTIIDQKPFTNKEDKNKIIDYNEEDTKKESIIKLNSKEQKIFKHALCPMCGEDLIKCEIISNFQKVVCKNGCKTEYAVNLNNEEIWVNKNEGL